MACVHQGEIDIDDQLCRRKAREAFGRTSGVEVGADLGLGTGPGLAPNHVSDLPWEMPGASEEAVPRFRHL